MSNEDILKKALRKAFDNGWHMVTPDDATRVPIMDDPVEDAVDYWDLDWREGRDAYYHLIFDHDFAKALWGEEDDVTLALSGMDTTTPWEYHLQHMVLAAEPLKYLEANI